MTDNVDLDSVELLDACLNYLDKLRESGVTNMLGAILYLQDKFPELSHEQARRVHTHWMQTFGEQQQRAKEVTGESQD